MNENDGMTDFTVFVQEVHTVPIKVRALHRQEAQAKAEGEAAPAEGGEKKE